jgi:PKD repeat protein
MKKFYSLLLMIVLTVGAKKISAQCTANFTYSIGLNGMVTFTDTSIGTNTSTTYSWFYSGGGNSSGATTSHSFGVNGTYTVYHSIYVPGSCTVSTSQTLVISNAPCNTPLFCYGYDQVLSGYTSSFTSLCSGTTGLASYTWNFGDGQSANTANAVHTYSGNGTYNAELKVSEGGACRDSMPLAVSVNGTCSLASNFVYTVNMNGTYFFQSTSTGTTNQTWYNWNYGDGNNGNGNWSQHTYTNNGTFNVSLWCTDPTFTPACGSTFSTAITVTNVLCPSFAASFTSASAGPGAVNFTSTSTGTSGTTGYNWNYGDLTSGTGSVSAHTYSIGGYHNVQLIINDGPCVDTITNFVNVTGIPCVANSNFSMTYGGTPGFWWGTPAYFGNVYAANWTWGDGTSTYALYPSHTYSALGFYSICVTVSTSCGTSTTCGNYNIYKMNGQVNSMAMATVNIVPSLQITGMKENNEENAFVSIYPNPSNGKINLRIDNIKSSKMESVIEVSDLLGRTVHTESAGVINEKINAELDLQDLNDGTYFVKVRSSERLYTSKIIISH